MFENRLDYRRRKEGKSGDFSVDLLLSKRRTIDLSLRRFDEFDYITDGKLSPEKSRLSGIVESASRMSSGISLLAASGAA